MQNQKVNPSASTKNKIALVALLILFSVATKYGFDSVKSEAPESQGKEIIGSGTINTIVDGVEVQSVNLWTSTKPDRQVACSVVKGQKLRVISGSGEYYYVEAVGRTGCEGYCMIGFVEFD